MINEKEIDTYVKQAIEIGRKNAANRKAFDPLSIHGGALIFALMNRFGFSGTYSVMSEDMKDEFNEVLFSILNLFAEQVSQETVQKVKEELS